MEDTTQFDLNQAIHNWHEDLAGSPAFRSGDLDELESHLRDSVVALQAKELSPHEAFWVARSRLGTRDALNSEFGKVNAEQVWLNRTLWMVIGSVAIGALSTLVSVLASFATLGIYEMTKQGHLLGPFNVVVNVGAFIGLFLLLWRSGRRNNGVVWQIGGWMKTHPVVTATSVFLFTAFNAAGLVGVNILAAKTMPISTYGQLMQWRMAATFPLVFLWPVVLAWLLVRTARKPVLQ